MVPDSATMETTARKEYTSRKNSQVNGYGKMQLMPSYSTTLTGKKRGDCIRKKNWKIILRKIHTLVAIT